MDQESPPCANRNLMFYYNQDPSAVSCSIIQGNECLMEGGFESMIDCDEKCSSTIVEYFLYINGIMH